MDFRARLVELLKQQSKSARELSDYIGAAQPSVSAWLTYKSYPSAKYISKIAKFLNVSPTFLLTGEMDVSAPPKLTPAEQAVLEKLHGLTEDEKYQVAGAISVIVAMQTSPFGPTNAARERSAVELFIGSTSRE